MRNMKTRTHVRLAILVSAILMLFGLAFPIFYKQLFVLFAAYVVLQYVSISSAWNILGGYGGYLNFGTAAFFGLGAYVSGYYFTKANLGFAESVVLGGLAALVLGVAVGLATLRLRGVYFAIATLAVTVVIQSFILNSTQFGSAVGLYMRIPAKPAVYGAFIDLLFAVLTVVTIGTILLSFLIENSKFGRGLMALRDDELAAETMGVPTFRLKLFATMISGLLIGLVGGLYPFYILYMEPYSVFDIGISVNAFVMPLIGGIGSWQGPIIGSLILATIQQTLSVTISSVYNLLFVGALIIAFILAAPKGLKGIFDNLASKRRRKGREEGRQRNAKQIGI